MTGTQGDTDPGGSRASRTRGTGLQLISVQSFGTDQTFLNNRKETIPPPKANQSIAAALLRLRTRGGCSLLYSVDRYESLHYFIIRIASDQGEKGEQPVGSAEFLQTYSSDHFNSGVCSFLENSCCNFRGAMGGILNT